MKVRVNYGRVWLETDVNSPKDAIRELSEFAEVFCEQTCGACKSTNVTASHREHDGHDYYSVRCIDCGAELSFGQKKNGRSLFAKRKDKDGNTLDNRGWTRWRHTEST